MWDKILGQDDAIQSIKPAFEAGTQASSYLFIGMEGLGKIDMARAMAASLMCADKACGECHSCTLLKRETHPDFVIIEPEGSQGYVIGQIRTLQHDMALAPSVARYKVYVIREADTFNAASGNAFLKTLEEPPPHVIIILLASNIKAVLPTIVSRCVVVRFKTLPQRDMLRILNEKTGATESDALIALASTGSRLGSAAAFLESNTRRGVRERIVRLYRDLPSLDDLEVLEAAKEISLALSGPVEEMRQKQEADLAARVELLSAPALKELEKMHKQRLSAFEKRNMREFLNILASLLRDTLITSKQAEELVLNADIDFRLERCFSPLKLDDARKAIEDARRRVSRNVGSLLVIETILFELREVSRCQR